MKHSCPFNRKYTFESACPMTVCPYHTSRSKQTFIFNENTQCTKLDAPHVIDSLVHESLANLDKTGFAKFNHRRVRRDLDTVIGHARSIVQIYDELPPDDYCKTCGAPTQCQNNDMCEKRMEWIDRVLTKLSIPTPPPIVKANIWNKLLNGTLELNDAVMERHGKACVNNPR